MSFVHSLDLRVGAVFFLLLATCSAPGKTTVSTDGTSLVLEARLESPPVEGDLGLYVIRIRNSSRSYVVLREFGVEGANAATASWQVSLPGRVEYDSSQDLFTVNRKEKGTPRPVFNLGLLAPEEEISFRARIRLLDFPKTFAIRYYAYDANEISRRVYFDRRVDRETRYVRLVGKELEERLIPSPATDVATHRTVAFPYAEQVEARPLEQGVTLQADLRRRSFSLAKALEKLGISSCDEHTYYAGLELWVVRSGEKAWLASPARTIPLPATRNLQGLFHLLDASEHPKVEVEFRKETKSLFAGDLPIVADGSGDRYVAFVPHAEILSLFEKVRDLGLAIDVEPGRLIVTR